MIEEKLKTNEKPLFFSLGANPSLAERISALSSIPLSPVKIAHFADGESFLKPLCPVEGKECFVLQSTASPVNERLMELAIFVDALHHAKAAKITLLVPYFGYARQDRIIDEGDPISGLLAEKMLQGAGADKLVVVDFHSEKLFNQFTLPHENLSAIPSFAQRLHQEIASQGKNSDSYCVVSPDCGGLARAQNLASLLDCPHLAWAKKSRPEPNKACVESLQGNVKGKTAIIIDDIIDTAGTLSEVVKVLYKEGAQEVWVAASHGVFSGPALERIRASGIRRLFTTDSIEKENRLGENVSLAPLFSAYLLHKETQKSFIPDEMKLSFAL